MIKYVHHNLVEVYEEVEAFNQQLIALYLSIEKSLLYYLFCSPQKTGT